MSKKLIAVAAAAALALTGLVAAPANATTISSVTLYHSGSAAGIATVSHPDSDSAVTANTWASARNVVFNTRTTEAATRTAVRFDVVTAAAGSVTVAATGGVRLATSPDDAAGVALKVDAGSQSLAGSTVTGALTYTFYAWNTSTTAGKVEISTSGSKNTYYVKGVAGPAYNLKDVTFPTSLYTGQTDGKVTYKVTDAYGNELAAGGSITPTGFGSGSNGAATYSATTKLWTSVLGTVSEDNVAVALALATADLSANGFAKPVKSAFKLISGGALADQVTALTAQVTSLQAQLAALTAGTVTKAKYNKLARKWNRANPSNRVKLQK